VPGQRALTLIRPDQSGIQQAALYDIDTDEVRILTSDSGDKQDVWMWQAPEFPGEHLLMAVVGSCCLNVYRQLGDVWTVIRTIQAPAISNFPDVISPELLVQHGRSYVMMVLGDGLVSQSEIWMAEATNPLAAPVQLSDPNLKLIRGEPEWMVTPNGVWVYYMEARLPNGFALRRLSTPIPL
jgi:hypothetical protein